MTPEEDLARLLEGKPGEKSLKEILKEGPSREENEAEIARLLEEMGG